MTYRKMTFTKMTFTKMTDFLKHCCINQFLYRFYCFVFLPKAVKTQDLHIIFIDSAKNWKDTLATLSLYLFIYLSLSSFCISCNIAPLAFSLSSPFLPFSLLYNFSLFYNFSLIHSFSLFSLSPSLLYNSCLIHSFSLSSLIHYFWFSSLSLSLSFI